MEQTTSPYILCKRLEGQLQSLLSQIDLPTLPRGEQRIIRSLKQGVVDARLSIQDYELSETREQQLGYAKESKGFLELVSNDILEASKHNLFGAVDVAHLGANIEQVVGYIR